jgi:hypothetical protein
MDVYHLETWGDWKNTYENYALLMALAISEGPEMVSRLWRESGSFEYPLQTYKRINGYTQAQFNDSLYQYARRMATYDGNNGETDPPKTAQSDPPVTVYTDPPVTVQSDPPKEVRI